MYTSYFYQVLNLAIERGEIPTSVRNLLQEWGIEYSNGTGDVFEQILTVPANGNFVRTDIVLNENSEVTATLLSDKSNTVFMFRNTAGCLTEGITLDFNLAIPITYAELAGMDDNLVFSNNSPIASGCEGED